ncbi:MAG: transposase, partial [Actinomycetia bacterium]|nr:transposase [Actinomycetes bacterium]
YVIGNGTILKMLGFNLGAVAGFNHKNKKQRKYPVDPDTIRKFFADSDPADLTKWFNYDFSSWVRAKGAYKSGIFVEDASYIILPDNKNYQMAERVWLDKDKHHTNKDTPGAKATLCYKLTTLLNTDRQGSYYLYAGARLDPGNVHGLNEGCKLVDGFTKSGGHIDTLLMDRGYIGGSTLTHYKKDLKINWVIPLRKDMDAYSDVMGLARAKNLDWKSYCLEQDGQGFTKRKEEVASFFNIGSWENLFCPLHVSIKRETDYENGEVNYFVLAHSKRYKYPSQAFDLYKRRTTIEERHRQLKEFWDLARFSSPAFSLVVTQILTKLATYSLMQLYLVRADMAKLARKTIATIKKKERAGECVVILYSGTHYGVFDLEEYSFIIMNLKTDAKKRFSRRIKTWNKSPPQD